MYVCVCINIYSQPVCVCVLSFREPSLSPSPRGLCYPSPLPLDVAHPPTSPQPQRQYQHVKASKSMDLGTSPTQRQQQPGGPRFSTPAAWPSGAQHTDPAWRTGWLSLIHCCTLTGTRVDVCLHTC